METEAVVLRLGQVFAAVLGQLREGQMAPPGRRGKTDLSPAQFEGLRFVATHPGCLVSEVAQGLRTSNPAATKLLDRLAARGMVVRLSGLADRRQVRLSVTAAGDRALRALREAQRASLRGILEKMTASDREALQAGLAAFLDAALQTPEDVDRVCRQCGVEHTPSCPLDAIRRRSRS